MKKNSILFLLLSFVLFVVTACGNEKNESSEPASGEVSSSIDKIKENGVIRIAVFSDKPPFGYVDENGNRCCIS